MNTNRPVTALCLLVLAVAPPSFAEEPAPPTPQDEFDRGESAEKNGDKAAAEAAYLHSVALDPKFEKGRAKLRSWYAAHKRTEAGGDVAKLADLIDWLGKAQLPEEASALAESLIKMDPECEKAHVFLGDEQVNGKWYTKEEADLARVAGEMAANKDACSKLSPREKKIYNLKVAMKGFGDKAEQDCVWLDCAPGSPFVLCMEKSPNYNAALMLNSFKEAVENFTRLFNESFGSAYDPKKFAKSEICLVYVFADRPRYAAVTGAPSWSGGHFEPVTGRAYLYKDTPTLYETLFEQCSIQLVHLVSRMNRGDGKPAAGTDSFWFSSGLAQYMENFKRDEKGGFTLGAASSQWVSIVRKQISDKKCRKLGEFMKLTEADVTSRSGDARWTSESWADSWAVVYFLLNYSDGKYRAKFLDYCKLALGGKGGIEAAKSCFGDLDALNREFEQYYVDMK